MSLKILLLLSISVCCLSSLSFSQSQESVHRIHYRIDDPGNGKLRLTFTNAQNEPLRRLKVQIRALEWAPDKHAPGEHDPIDIPFKVLVNGHLGNNGEVEISLAGFPLLSTSGRSVQVWLEMSRNKVLLVRPDLSSKSSVSSLSYMFGRWELFAHPLSAVYLQSAKLSAVKTTAGQIPNGFLKAKFEDNLGGQTQTHFFLAGSGWVDAVSAINEFGLEMTWNGALFLRLSAEVGRAIVGTPPLELGRIRFVPLEKNSHTDLDGDDWKLSCRQDIRELSLTLKSEIRVRSHGSHEFLWYPRSNLRIETQLAMTDPRSLKLIAVDPKKSEMTIKAIKIEKVQLSGVSNDSRIQVRLFAFDSQQIGNVALKRTRSLDDAAKSEFIYLESPVSNSITTTPLGREPHARKSFNKPMVRESTRPSNTPSGWLLDLSEFSASLPGRLYRPIEFSLLAENGQPLANQWVHFGGGRRNFVSEGLVLSDSRGRVALQVPPHITDIPVRISAGIKIKAYQLSGVKLKVANRK